VNVKSEEFKMLRFIHFVTNDMEIASASNFGSMHTKNEVYCIMHDVWQYSWKGNNVASHRWRVYVVTLETHKQKTLLEG
jgi:hypothetical protein